MGHCALALTGRATHCKKQSIAKSSMQNPRNEVSLSVASNTSIGKAISVEHDSARTRA